MIENLNSFGVDLESFPIVLQYNKRDFDEIIPLGKIEEILELPQDLLVTESVATSGAGVMKTLQLISKEVIRNFQLD